jgi:hypothetical protein
MEELAKDIKNHGCVLFDVEQDLGSGEWRAKPGAGWASVDGDTAFRVARVEDLSKDVMWLTNLDRDVHWRATLYNVPQIKDSKYLRLGVDQLMREIGVSPKAVGPAHSAEAVAEIFGRIMRLAREQCDRLGWGRGDLIQELSQGFGIHDAPHEDPLLDEAFSRSYQDRVDCHRPEKGDTSRWVTLRRPRLLHAQQIIGKSFMVPNGPWRFIGEKDMPTKKDDRVEWVHREFGGAPFMVKVRKINFFRPLETDSCNPADLLKLGESFLPGRPRAPREWMPMPELLYMSKFADIDFDSVCVGSYYDELGFDILPELNGMMHHSYAWGVLAENMWLTYASRSINRQTQNKTLVSARATWLRAVDRFYCFVAAHQMSIPDVSKVLFYGSGGVTVACKEPDIGRLIQHGVDCGLQSPSSSYLHWAKWGEKEKRAQELRQTNDLQSMLGQSFEATNRLTKDQAMVAKMDTRPTLRMEAEHGSNG